MPELTIVLPGSIRSKKNSKRPCTVGGVNVPRRTILLPSKAYGKWERAARAMALESAIVPPLSCPVEVCATVYYSGHAPDLSGALESVGDCLEGILWADDGQIESWDGSRRVHDLRNPRTVVTVRWE